ncbi:N-acetylmuramidase domain-containing protein [Mesorhizobium muleiense]|uniref:N-acetylmuramidase domain-containing protein n=1 Tax=Mesorhizobium muleiense TaxID=1004279 RepID=UPI001F2CEE7E|nr:N-acetylmuramidase domain-containing protein [Mesorhizobium muleiense]MCF6120547.1 N-acetylmuramidase domain-containing protein [Mesorhizobium muleiense]
MFDAPTLRAIGELADRLKCPAAALQAAAEVESNGQVFAMVKGKQEPLIRFEGHYFDARLKAADRAVARAQDLSSPVAGRVKNPAAQAKRWELVTRAAKINRQAALESFSIGLGQVMTAHWRKLGFNSVDDMIKLARAGAAGQIDIMARYIDKFGLADELRRLDFPAFARGYNGAGYKKQGYHLKMAAAYRRLSGSPPVSASTGMLRMGSNGARVRALQTLLVRAGYTVNVDGDYGPSTRDAVRDFQKAQKLAPDGVVGPETLRRLEAWKQGAAEQPGEQPVTEVPEVKDATKGGGLLVLIIAARDQVAETASYLTGIEADTAQTVANVLLAGSGAIGLGLAAYAVWGWIKSRRTDEGDIDPDAAAEVSAPDPVLA